MLKFIKIGLMLGGIMAFAFFAVGMWLTHIDGLADTYGFSALVVAGIALVELWSALMVMVSIQILIQD